MISYPAGHLFTGGKAGGKEGGERCQKGRPIGTGYPWRGESLAMFLRNSPSGGLVPTMDIAETAQPFLGNRLVHPCNC